MIGIKELLVYYYYRIPEQDTMELLSSRRRVRRRVRVRTDFLVNPLQDFLKTY